ncbi:MAG TPA: dephospho-CoA kinase [Telmatospirillum sp.]|nr:dephospho-CoA kinase [Telmatospirillum sp.]
MIILGLTGSIGMGKSTAGRQLRTLGVPVYDADAAVHRLLAKGGAAVARIEQAFPQVVHQGVVDRRRLGAAVFGDDAALTRLEAILHPLVRRQERAFLQRARRRRIAIVALDIPLLFEAKAERRVDATVVVTCPAFLQKQRVLARPGMTAGKLAAILQRQMDDPEKRRRADFVIPTGIGRRWALRKLCRVVKQMRDQGTSRHMSGSFQ